MVGNDGKVFNCFPEKSDRSGREEMIFVRQLHHARPAGRQHLSSCSWYEADLRIADGGE